MSALEDRITNLEKKLDIFKDDVHKNDMTTITTLTRIEILLRGLLTKKGAVGYGASSGGITYVILELLLK